MAKVSISLPDNTQIVVEAEEAELLRDVVGMALRESPRVQSSINSNGTAEKGRLPAAEASPPPNPNAGRPRSTSTPRRPAARRSSPTTTEEDAGARLQLDEQPQQSRDDFAAYCHYLNPMGDMRRVVVAAEGAGRFLAADGVDAEDLGSLFDLAGWRRPGNFTQTLRNAARSKFGWLERVPGRSGRYAVTELGRSVTAGE